LRIIFTFLFAIVFAFSSNIDAQESFRFIKPKKKQVKLKFSLINNLIVIPLNVNGKKLSFILDSGVSKTILFNITQNDSIGLNNVKTVQLQGLGKGESVEALLSKKNTISIKNLISFHETIYVILKDYFDLSGKMGTTIHGIIGYNLLKDFVVKINYKSKYISFYKPENYKFKKCKKCEIFPIQFYRKKPYINAKVQLDTISDNLIDTKLLIDSGGSDALWLFEHTKKEIVTPNRFFNDILGEGLSGSIYGNRSRVPKLKLGRFELPEPTVSFLDTLSTKNARNFKDRNGSIGAGVLKRFIVWFDYPNRRFMLKKNGSLKNGFNYNMSGLDVVYDGKQLVKEEDGRTYFDAYNQSLEGSNSISFISSFSYKFKPSFKIRNVVEGSPSFKVGLQKGDVILRLNNKPAHEFKLGEIIQKFQDKDGKKIKLTINRNGQKMKFEFRLEKKV
jgi:hypothetical protein